MTSATDGESWHNFEAVSDDEDDFISRFDNSLEFGECASTKFDDEFASDEENIAYAVEGINRSRRTTELGECKEDESGYQCCEDKLDIKTVISTKTSF